MKTPTDISKRRHLYFQELPICQILRLGGSPRIQMLHQCFGNLVVERCIAATRRLGQPMNLKKKNNVLG